MISFGEAEKVGAPMATASTDEVTRNPEVVDFEELLADLSAAFIRVPAEKVDAELERWLELIVLAMNIDFGIVVQFEHSEDTFYTTHQVARPGLSVPDRGRKVDNTALYPWLARQTRSGELVIISRLDDLPPEASRDRARLRYVGQKSNLTIPLRIGGIVVGAMQFGTVFSERAWT